MKKIKSLLILFAIVKLTLSAQETEILYLSGTGNTNTVDWEFFCTEGRNSGEWTTIPVPSNWELEGFGTYNYGLDKDSVRGKEMGMYRCTFNIPEHWRDKTINLVFDGSMTDTEVKVNGKSAGAIHQGAFYRFSFPITKLVDLSSENLLEVTVSKHSSDLSVNRAERFADYWIFGGIFRPVYLEALPGEHIQNVAIDANADGSFSADVFYTQSDKPFQIKAQIYTPEGQKVSVEFGASTIPSGSNIEISTTLPSINPWSPEFPNLYLAEFNLMEGNKIIHRYTQRFGFRTIELRERDGIYLNGAKIKFKGVNRHSFRPESGRTVSKKISINDVLLMKEMNMNAVRNSHYPADKHFYEACDSLGLLVLDELGGWHDAYDTDIGSQLLSSMLKNNQNHPSIVVWVNGNEGGHNHELLPVFDSLDKQQRPVVHAWEILRGTDTQHYINYDYGAGTHFHGHEIVFPTEFLHGLYDGGHGAGLYDYWEYMWKLPLSAGGFLWDFADEGVVRTDQDGKIDTDGDHGADGILGPHLEKEGSFYTIKEVWSPIYFEPREISSSFDGKFKIENRYMFTNTIDCHFTWQLVKLPDPYLSEAIEKLEGIINSPTIDPGQGGVLKMELPADWAEYDVLYIKAEDPHSKEVYTWSFPVKLPSRIASSLVIQGGRKKITHSETEEYIIIAVGEITMKLNRSSGNIKEIKNSDGIIPLNNGPVLCDGENDLQDITWKWDNDNFLVEYAFGENSNFKSLDWTIFPSGWIKLSIAYRPQEYLSDFMGINFSFPGEEIRKVQWMGEGPYRVWKNRMRGTKLGVWENDYNNTTTGIGDLIYPEFKGYFSGIYWSRFYTDEQSFTVVADNEDIFLRLLTPESPDIPYNTAPAFPRGDISFLQAIPPIGTKSQTPENLGPSGKKNMYFDYWKQRAKEMTLYFDFRSQPE